MYSYMIYENTIYWLNITNNKVYFYLQKKNNDDINIKLIDTI